MRTVDLTARTGPTSKAITLAAGVDAGRVRRGAVARSVGAEREPLPLSRLRSATASRTISISTPRDQWYLYKSNVDPTAWSYTHGRTGVDVALIDTGVDETNQDFIFDWKESDVNGVQTTGNGSVQDTNGHGTSTAGFAVAQTNNSYGFAGVGLVDAPDGVQDLPERDAAAATARRADTADEATAINDAVAHGASVISLSLGSPQNGADFDPPKRTRSRRRSAPASSSSRPRATSTATARADGNQPDYPAAYPGVIAAGASAVGTHTANNYSSIQNETVASYSNSGATLVAPGGDPGNDTRQRHAAVDRGIRHDDRGVSRPISAPNSGGVCRALWAGTSMSTPQVAGAVALMEAYHGGARSLTPAQVKSILTSTADNIGASATRMGAGRLNTGNAVAAAHP